MSDRVAVFIDGAYLDKVLQEEFNSPRIDYEKFAHWMTLGIPLFRSYYYHCLPYQSNPPTEEQRGRYVKKQAFFNRIANLPQFDVRLGKLEFRGFKEGSEPVFIQKRVDILLGIDLVLMAAKQRITHATIFTGDSDFLPAITTAKNEGVIMTLGHGILNPPHEELWKVMDQRLVLTRHLVQSMIRP